MKIWTDDECIEVDPNDIGQLEAAMLFKAKHIKAKADPELFAAVADTLSRLWDSATKRVDVAPVRHGWWNADETCSCCGEKSTEGLDAEKWNYWFPDFCPNCGARMDGDKNA